MDNAPRQDRVTAWTKDDSTNINLINENTVSYEKQTHHFNMILELVAVVVSLLVFPFANLEGPNGATSCPVTVLVRSRGGAPRALCRSFTRSRPFSSSNKIINLKPLHSFTVCHKPHQRNVHSRRGQQVLDRLKQKKTVTKDENEKENGTVLRSSIFSRRRARSGMFVL
jgi:hypothetical protein